MRVMAGRQVKSGHTPLPTGMRVLTALLAMVLVFLGAKTFFHPVHPDAWPSSDPDPLRDSRKSLTLKPAPIFAPLSHFQSHDVAGELSREAVANGFATSSKAAWQQDFKLLLASHNRLFWYWPATDQVKLLHEGGGVHYGTFPGTFASTGALQTLWVVIRPHNWQPETSEEFLVELDVESGLELSRVKISSRFTHDAVRFGDRVFICDTEEGAILELDFPNMTQRRQLQLFTLEDHINTLMPLSETQLWVVLHKLGKSDAVKLDLGQEPPVEVARISDIGTKAHGLVLWRDSFILLDSEHGAVLRLQLVTQEREVLWKAPEGGKFLKGLVVVDDVAYFGISVWSPRSARGDPDVDSEVAAVDLVSGQLLWRRLVPTRGLLNIVATPHLPLGSGTTHTLHPSQPATAATTTTTSTTAASTTTAVTGLHQTGSIWSAATGAVKHTASQIGDELEHLLTSGDGFSSYQQLMAPRAPEEHVQPDHNHAYKPHAPGPVHAAMQTNTSSRTFGAGSGLAGGLASHAAGHATADHARTGHVAPRHDAMGSSSIGGSSNEGYSSDAMADGAAAYGSADGYAVAAAANMMRNMGFPPQIAGRWSSGLPFLDLRTKQSPTPWRAGIQLPLMSVDVRPVKWLLEDMPEEMWDPAVQRRLNAFIEGRENVMDKFKPGLTTLLLMFSDRSTRHTYTFPYFSLFKDVLQPILWQILGEDVSNIIRIQFARMPPGGIIKVHKDMGGYANRGHRIHVPIIVYPGVSFQVCPQLERRAMKTHKAVTEEDIIYEDDCIEIPMSEGLVFEVNNRVFHRVVNPSTKPRVQLVVDVMEHPKQAVPLAPGTICDYEDTDMHCKTEWPTSA